MKKYSTDQERFWAGKFGNSYSKRNRGSKLLSSQIAFFSRVLERTNMVQSVIEFGANIGINLKALKFLIPNIQLSAVEINKSAIQELKKWKEGKVKLYNQSILDFKIDYQRDFVLVKGLLIHINPDKLNLVYELLYKTSSAYICIAEYYNPTPIAIKYRNYNDRLFKRDFCGELMDKYKDLELIDYGFIYHRDNNFPQDDINWFLLKKIGNNTGGR